MAADLDELQPLDFNEYDVGVETENPSAIGADADPADADLNGDGHVTQMDEDLGVQDLGVDDVVNTSAFRRPRPKLDADKLLNPRKGYPALLRGLRKVKYRGPGDEKKFLRKYVMTYQIWANRLWPKANFDDFIVLARRAGKDPRVRQYCRDLIENEKYGSSEPYELPADANLDESEPDNLAVLDPLRESETPPRVSGSPEPANHSASTTNASANSSTAGNVTHDIDPAELDPADFAENHENEAAGPDDDEMEAAMELYGDLGF